MRALQLVAWGKPAELRDVAMPEPGPGQVVIQVGGAGACHSDLHLMDWPPGMLSWKLPFTLGHENAGRIARLGAGVTGFREGDAVVVYGPWGCGRCRPCRLGRENYCEHAGEIGVAGGGLGLDGGMAEYMLVPSARHLVPIGKLDPVLAAPIADAALTPYHAIVSSRAHLYAGATAVVIGCGGLGQMAIQLLRATTGATVIAVDRDPAKLERARQLGAAAAISANDDAATAIRRELGGAGADLVLDMVGADSTLALGAKLLRAGGRMVLVGLAGGTLPISFFGLPYGASVATSYWGTVTELAELVALAGAGRLRIDVEKFALADALAAYAKLREGRIAGRAVVVPS